MKVVLFCGGQGMRMRPLTPEAPGAAGNGGGDLPKPMVHVGGMRPLLWHVMKYYAHYGHKDFILCLGYRGDAIKEYFLHYKEYLTNDFVLADGGASIDLITSDIKDWRITFVDTGLTSSVGQRLMAVRDHLEGEECFLANYSDGLSDLPLEPYQRTFDESGKTAAFACVRPPHSSHIVRVDDEGAVTGIAPLHDSGVWINGGYFIFRKEIFDHMEAGEDLVDAPFHRLIAANKLLGYRYDGFWTCIDTFKEKQDLDEMWARGDRPWEVWR